jgi:hypothetical protein
VKIIYARNNANRHKSTACDNRCLVNRIDTIDIFAACLFVTVDTVDLNTRDGRDVTQVPGRVASRVKNRLSPIYVHEVLFVCEIAFGVSCQQALLSSQTDQWRFRAISQMHCQQTRCTIAMPVAVALTTMWNVEMASFWPNFSGELLNKWACV